MMIHATFKSLIMMLTFFLMCSIVKASDEDTLLKKTERVMDQRLFPQLQAGAATKNSTAFHPYRPEFTETFIATYDKVDTGTASNRVKAQQTIEEIERRNHYTDYISPNDLAELPVGLKKKMGNSAVTIGISKAKLMNGYTALTVYCKVMLPQGKAIFFGADDIRLSHGGGLIGNAQLVLLGDFSLPFNGGNLLLTLKGGQQMHTAPDQYQTYAKLECGGIKEIGLAADVIFPKNMLVPLKPDYTVDQATDARVRGSFSTIVTDWNDILAEINLKPFAIKGLERFGILVDKAVFDFSDKKNSTDVAFPAGYQNLVPGNEALWRGVYVNKLKVLLPKEFKKRGTTERVSFEASHMLVDNIGLTGSFSANHILPSGSASGWDFSVDHFELNIQANHLKAAGFEGHIGLPLTKRQEKDSLSKTGFGYTAIISPGNQYLMRVNPLQQIKFDVWQASAQLSEGSYVELLVRDDQFRPKAVLNGSMSVKVIRQSDTEPADSEAKPLTDIKGIVFQQLILQTEAPYIQADYFGYKGEAKLGNFPIVISDIGLVANNREAALQVSVQVNLMAEKLSAMTKLKIVGELIRDKDAWDYRYKRTDISRLEIAKCDFGGFKIKGYADFHRHHPIMGNGFAGNLMMTVKLGKEIEVAAKAAFGSSPAEAGQPVFRYWYVDALASGFVIPAGGFNITALGGGASYHMRKRADMMADTSVSPTGLHFMPDINYGLGFRASIGFNVTSEKACHGEAGLEMMFNRSGGIANIGLFGKAFFFSSLGDGVGDKAAKMKNNLADFTKKITGIDSAKIANSILLGKFTDVAPLYETGSSVGGEGSISAFVGIQYDVENKTLHANVDVYANLAKGAIRGRASGNRAGWAVMHFAPDEWYVHLGTPADRLGLRMGVGSISAEAGGYFMVGSRIPGSPPPPKIVADILGVQLSELDYMRDLNALGEGRGFAFGADFSVNTGDMRFLMFYASFQAGLGFDIMLKDYGDAQCVGRSGPIGMNGWYANGQAYAYLQGELGIQIKLFMVRKRIPIIKAGAAVLLQAKLPNPAWFRGYVGGHFSVLGGLIKGKFRFKVTIGQECELANTSPLDNIKVIADFSPADKSAKVDVFAAPQAVFNMPVDKAFNIEEEQGTKTYRIRLEEYSVSKEGKHIAGVLKWNSRQDAVLFESAEILPPNAIIKARVKVRFEQQSGAGWQTVYDNGQPAMEQQEISFTTGTAPETIPLSNIAYSYPAVAQRFFYTKEYGKAYVQLKRGQSYLFNDAVYNKQAKFLSNNEGIQTIKFVYDSMARRVNLDLPVLPASQDITLVLEGKPVSNEAESVTRSTQQVTDDDNDIQIRNNSANGVMTSAKAFTYLEYTFGSSRYATFGDKMRSKIMQRPMYEIILSDVGALQAEVSNTEPFDITELTGTSYTDNKPLLQPVAVLTDRWFLDAINPLIYADYPQMPGLSLDRDSSLLGIPPVRALEPLTWYLDQAVLNERSDLLRKRMPHRYYLGYYYKADLNEMQYKVVNQYVKSQITIPEHLTRFVSAAFPVMQPGKYRVSYQYILPGGIFSSSFGFDFENPVRQ